MPNSPKTVEEAWKAYASTPAYQKATPEQRQAAKIQAWNQNFAATKGPAREDNPHFVKFMEVTSRFDPTEPLTTQIGKGVEAAVGSAIAGAGQIGQLLVSPIAPEYAKRVGESTAEIGGGLMEKAAPAPGYSAGLAESLAQGVAGLPAGILTTLAPAAQSANVGDWAGAGKNLAIGALEIGATAVGPLKLVGRLGPEAGILKRAAVGGLAAGAGQAGVDVLTGKRITKESIVPAAVMGAAFGATAGKPVAPVPRGAEAAKPSAAPEAPAAPAVKAGDVVTDATGAQHKVVSVSPSGVLTDKGVTLPPDQIKPATPPAPPGAPPEAAGAPTAPEAAPAEKAPAAAPQAPAAPEDAAIQRLQALSKQTQSPEAQKEIQARIKELTERRKLRVTGQQTLQDLQRLHAEYTDLGMTDEAQAVGKKIAALQEKMQKLAPQAKPEAAPAAPEVQAAPKAEEAAPAAPEISPGGSEIKQGNVGLAGGQSDDLKTTVIDKAIPKTVTTKDGKTWDVHQSIAYHEDAERSLLKQGHTYEEAHRIATEMEHDRMRRAGFDPNEIEAQVKPHIDEAAHRARVMGEKTTPEVSQEPYKESGETGMLEQEKPESAKFLDRTGAVYSEPQPQTIQRGKTSLSYVIAKGPDGKWSVLESTKAHPLVTGQKSAEAAQKKLDTLVKSKGLLNIKKQVNQLEDVSQAQLQQRFHVEPGEATNAAQERQKPEGGIVEHQGAGEERATAEAGGGNRPARGGPVKAPKEEIARPKAQAPAEGAPAEPEAGLRRETDPKTGESVYSSEYIVDPEPLKRIRQIANEVFVGRRPEADLANELRAQESIAPADRMWLTKNEALREIEDAIGKKATQRLLDSGFLHLRDSVEFARNSDTHQYPLVSGTSRVGGAYNPKTGRASLFYGPFGAIPGGVRGTLAHEIGEHAGMQRMMGARKYVALLRELRDRHAELPEIDKAYRKTAENATYRKLGEDSPAFWSEVLARFITDHPEPLKHPVLESLRYAVRAFLRKLGIPSAKLDERDLKYLVLSALRRELSRGTPLPHAKSIFDLPPLSETKAAGEKPQELHSLIEGEAVTKEERRPGEYAPKLAAAMRYVQQIGGGLEHNVLDTAATGRKAAEYVRGLSPEDLRDLSRELSEHAKEMSGNPYFHALAPEIMSRAYEIGDVESALRADLADKASGTSAAQALRMRQEYTDKPPHEMAARGIMSGIMRMTEREAKEYVRARTPEEQQRVLSRIAKRAEETKQRIRAAGFDPDTVTLSREILPKLPPSARAFVEKYLDHAQEEEDIKNHIADNMMKNGARPDNARKAAEKLVRQIQASAITGKEMPKIDPSVLSEGLVKRIAMRAPEARAYMELVHRYYLRGMEIVRQARGDRFDMTYEWYRSSLHTRMSLPAVKVSTDIVNGMYTLFIRNPLERVLAGDVEGAVKGFGESMRALVEHFPEAVRIGMESWTSNLNLFQQKVFVARAQRLYLEGEKPGKMGTSELSFNPSLLPKELRAINWNLGAVRAIQAAADSLFSRATVANEARILGLERGLKGDALQKFVSEEIADMGSDSWQRAIKQERFITATQERGEEEGAVQGMLSKILEKINAAKNIDVAEEILRAGPEHALSAQIRARVTKEAARYTFPFIWIPYNLMRVAFLGELSPVSPLRLILRTAGNPRYAMTRNFRNDMIGSAAVVGTVALASSLMYDENGEPRITGFGERADGLPEASINVGGKWYTYRELGYPGRMLGAAVTIAETMHKGDLSQSFSEAMGAFFHEMGNETAWRGLSDIIHMIEYMGQKNNTVLEVDEQGNTIRRAATLQENMRDALGQEALRIGLGFYPTMLKNIAAARQEETYQYQYPGAPMSEKLMGRAERNIHQDLSQYGIGDVRFPTTPPAVDYFGSHIPTNPMHTSFWVRLLSPVEVPVTQGHPYAIQDQYTPLRVALAKYNDSRTLYAPKLEFLAPSTNLRMRDRIYHLTPDQYHDMLQTAGKTFGDILLEYAKDGDLDLQHPEQWEDREVNLIKAAHRRAMAMASRQTLAGILSGNEATGSTSPQLPR